MSLPPKEYFGLEEVEERWGMPRRDLVYYAENGHIKISARVVGVLLETGIFEAEPDGRWFKIPETRELFSGLLALCDRDLAAVLRHGATRVERFGAESGRYLDVCEAEGGIEVRLDNLVVTREERDRFEREHQLLGEEGSILPDMPDGDAGSFAQRNDYTEVTLGGRTYRLGTCQAAVVRVLHEASLTDSPWLAGKLILNWAGSGGTRMRDLFKKQPGWRDLIASDGRGMYRLNLPSDGT